jgi:DNA topoisomerase-1
MNAPEPPRTAARRTFPASEGAAGSDLPLRYVGDEPGFRRRRRGRGFEYTDTQGRRVGDRGTLARIRALAIPPAWTEVWICVDPRGHLQATGRDARGRKQYRYHPRWTAMRKDDRFERLLEVGEALPRIRRRVSRALAGTALSRERVLAAVVSLLDSTFARIGNREYRRANGSFGLTTLENRHAREIRGGIRLEFQGKSGVRHELDIDDPRVVRVVRRCQSLPGQRLFQFLDESGRVQAVDSQDVNDWLREATGREMTAKGFRTWHGTALALDRLLRLEPPDSERAARAAEVTIVDEVAARLGNTRSVCRNHYIHPALFDEFESGRLHRGIPLAGAPRKVRGLTAREARLATFLRGLETRRAAEGAEQSLERAS